jgi:DNA-binding winged helix-turn-helix (wHTH) protein/TolB-like protein/tetratricopeptide (TPR) repeat protein
MSDANPLRFGAFELDPKSGELRKDGDPVKLPPQPFKVLTLLARRSGEVVTRNEIREQIWGDETFVDFDQGLNFCIRQIRGALGDDAEAPRFIETLPRRGYRFLLPIERGDAGGAARLIRLIVLPFRMLRPDPETEFLAFGLPDAITTSVSGLTSLVVRSSIVASRFAGESADLKRIAAEADVDVVLSGTLLRAGEQVRVSTQLTEVPAGTLLCSQTSQVPLGDIFQVQDELTHRIVGSLSLPLSAREHRMLKRDVPSSAKAYEFFLRANQLSHDSKQWDVARELYLKCVEEDPRYAPAWARLGRIYHVMGKYLDSGGGEGLEHADAAFRRALEINPDLAVAHKLYAQLEVDLGRAEDAMVRLLERARSADPELFAGLVSTCRYCGLLDASIAADAQARRLDARVRTSVAHTWFLRTDYARLEGFKLDEIPYIGALWLDAVGRYGDAIAALRHLEEKTRTRMRDFMIAARALLEGNAAESLAAVGRVVSSDFRDPEGLFYLTRHLAHLKQIGPALDLFRRVVAGGFVCFPAMERDPWLDPLRKTPEFAKLLGQAEARHRKAGAAFARMKGSAVLGLAAPAKTRAKKDR